jgi:hypothetical protein
MLTQELKKQLIDKIQSTEDNSILEDVYRILEVGTLDIEMVVLSNSQKKNIDQGLEDIEKGRYLTDDEADKEIKEWLKK